MRGNPLVQSIVVLLAVILAGVPVYRLTRPASAARPGAPPPVKAAVVPAANAAAAPLDVEAVFAPAPADFEVKSVQETVLAGRGPGGRFTARWSGSVPPEGADFVMRARWSAPAGGNAPAAAKLTVRLPDGRVVAKSFWADANGAVTDVLTLPGAATPPDAP